VLELAAARVSVVVCAASPASLDSLPGDLLRIAPDEALVVGDV